MKIATVNIDLYRYELHALIKAFYPEEDVKVFVLPDRAETPEDAALTAAYERDVRNFMREKGGDGETSAIPFLGVHYEPEALTVHVTGWPEAGAGARAGNPGENIPAGMEAEAPSAAVFLYEPGHEELPDGFSGPFDVGSQALKTALKHMLYRIFSERTGRQLPWGELIGIRPTKLAMERMERGMTGEEAARDLEKNYHVSREKAQLAAAIAEREREILSKTHCEAGRSLYIGIPFCPTTCLYCSFTSYPLADWKEEVDHYLDALELELRGTAELMDAGRFVLDTIYIGGGTPTTLEPAQLERLLGIVEECYPTGRLLEFTCEAGRPDSITRDKLRVLRAHGVDRISVNPQSMNERTLRLIGRAHRPEQVVRAFHMAREEGFENINMDMILGLPEETEEEVRATMRALAALRPDDLTVHSLALKRGSRMQAWIEENGFCSLRNTEETMRIAAEGAAEMGLVPYYLYRQKNMSGNFENVGYARPAVGDRPARYGIYNILIMEEKQTILACGAGTSTKVVVPDGEGKPGGRTIARCFDPRDLRTYLEHVEACVQRKRELLEKMGRLDAGLRALP